MEIVVVMGVGFVGAVMAAIVTDTADEKGKPSKFVIGMQRPSIRSFWTGAYQKIKRGNKKDNRRLNGKDFWMRRRNLSSPTREL